MKKNQDKPERTAGKLLSASDGTLYKIGTDGAWRVQSPKLKPKELRRRAKLARERKKAEKAAAEEMVRIEAHVYKPLMEEAA